MKNFLFTILLFTCTSFNLISENNPLFQYNENSFFLFRFGRGETSDMSNYFVRELAKINYLNPYRTSYSMEYGLEIEVNELEGNRLEIISNFIPKKLYGDVAYKDFNLTEVLEPTIYGFHLTISVKNNPKITYETSMLPVGEVSADTLQLSGDFDLDRADYLVSDIQISYNDLAIVRFNRRIAEIHDYLGTLELIGYSLEKVRKINPEDKNDLFSTYIRIYELEKVQYHLQQQQINPELVIPAEYSTPYQSGLLEMNNQIRRLRTILSNTLGLQGYFFGDETYAEAAGELLAIQAGYLEALTTTNHFYEPVYQQMAGFFRSSDDWVALISDATQTFHDLDAEIFRKRFSEQLWESYMTMAETYFNTERYNEALLMLSSAGVICRSNTEIECGLQVFHNISKAKFGIYDSYLHIAESAMSVQNLNLARRYLNLALDFQANNSSLIIIPAAVNKLFEDLAWLYFEEGRKAVRDEKWDAALANLTSAKEIYATLKMTAFNEAIEKELAKIGK